MDCVNQRIQVWMSFSMSIMCDIAVIWQMLTKRNGGDIFTNVLITMILAIVTILLGYLFPAVSLYEEGVYVRRFFYTKKYQWETFCQIGIGRYDTTHILSLFDGVTFMLLPDAVKHDPKENFTQNKLDAFLLRNLFHMISFRVDQEELEIIEKNYGDLDFDVIIHSIFYKEKL